MEQEQNQKQKPARRSRIVKQVLGIALAIAAVVGWKFYNKSESSSDVRNAIASWIQATPVYEENKDYIDGLLSSVHDEAFDQTYRMGGRRSRTRFDANEYVRLVFTGMASRADEDGRPEIAAAVRKAQSSYYAARPGDVQH